MKLNKSNPQSCIYPFMKLLHRRNFLICFTFADGKHPFPLVMVGKVLEANRRWDIGKEVIDCVTKHYPGAYPIHPKVEPAVGAALLAWNAIASELDGDIRNVQ